MKLPASQIVIRPPVEAYSVLIPVTGGCSWNRCRFCGVYKNVQDYEIRALDDVLEDIDRASIFHKNHKSVFLAGGNPTSAPTDFLVKIIDHVKLKFKKVERISTYCKSLDIVKKSDEELKRLADAGLDIVYMGLESGSNKVLKYMRKGTNNKTAISAAKRLMDAGIDVSLYVILGLGGYEMSQDHVRETARVLTEINPTIFRFRTLNVLKNAPLWKDLQDGTYEVMKPVDVIKELRDIIALLGDNVTSEVYNDHVSNYVAFSSKNISDDRERILGNIDRLLEDPDIKNLEPKYLQHM